jgi:hypothetical protein
LWPERVERVPSSAAVQIEGELITARQFAVFMALTGAVLAPGAAPDALPRAAPLATTAGPLMPVIDRPEMRSYQPYSGLQYGFRPTPPIERGMRRDRPEVVMPTPVPPLIRSGVPHPYSAQWYAYCAQKYRSFEPGTGLYTTFSGDRRMCR